MINLVLLKNTVINPQVSKNWKTYNKSQRNSPNFWPKIFSKVNSPVFSKYFCMILRTLKRNAISNFPEKEKLSFEQKNDETWGRAAGASCWPWPPAGSCSSPWPSSSSRRPALLPGRPSCTVSKFNVLIIQVWRNFPGWENDSTAEKSIHKNTNIFRARLKIFPSNDAQVDEILYNSRRFALYSKYRKFKFVKALTETYKI